MTKRTQVAISASAFILCIGGLSGCPGGGGTTTPIVTSVGKSVTTLQKTSSLANCAGTAPPMLPQEPQDWWNAMPPANHQYPFAGWEVFQPGPGGCAGLRIDAYRAVVTFNMGSVSNLKGLVQKAELVVETRALPPAAAMTLNSGPLGQTGSINLFCVKNQGGAGSVVRFGPNAPGPATTPNGDLQLLGANAFPTGTNTVYTLTSTVQTGPVAGASDPTVGSLSGNGGSVYITDVTSQVTAALNGNATAMTWMVTSNTEGPLPGALTMTGDFDCRTSYNFDLRITHL